MVKARGPSKGADWIARERGMIRPRVHSSTSLFNQKGNPWLTKEEQNREYPLNRSNPGDKPETELQKEAREIRNRTREAVGLPVADFKAPAPRVEVNPDLDCFTKARKAEPKKPYVDPEGTPVVRDQARWRAELMRKMNRLAQGEVVNCRDKVVKPTKVKGSFYRFPDVTERVPDSPRHEPRPFLGIGRKK